MSGRHSMSEQVKYTVTYYGGKSCWIIRRNNVYMCTTNTENKAVAIMNALVDCEERQHGN